MLEDSSDSDSEITFDVENRGKNVTNKVDKLYEKLEKISAN